MKFEVDLNTILILMSIAGAVVHAFLFIKRLGARDSEVAMQIEQIIERANDRTKAMDDKIDHAKLECERRYGELVRTQNTTQEQLNDLRNTVQMLVTSMGQMVTRQDATERELNRVRDRLHELNNNPRLYGAVEGTQR